MTKKELKKLAKEIAGWERIIQTTDDPNRKYVAEQTVMNLTNQVDDMEDIIALDELIMNILNEKT